MAAEPEEEQVEKKKLPIVKILIMALVGLLLVGVGAGGTVGGGTAARERDPHTGQPCKGHRRRDGRPETANGARRSRRKGGVQFRRVHGLD
jgi:flagellar basal body-associated protein FliL